MRAWMMASAAVLVGAMGSLSLGQNEEQKAPTLAPGDQAPALTVTDWVQGQSFDGFKKGQVYVLDFWATWCHPCIQAMPHLTKVQAEHPESVTVVAVDIWENKDWSKAERIEKVTDKVKSLGDKMKVRVAIDGDGSMTKNWFEAAGRNGIPSTFIVDQAGRVAWIGHPMEMEEPLAKILAGEWDVNAFKTKYEQEMKKGKAMQELFQLLSKGDYKPFYEKANAYLDTYLKDDEMMLNQLAWIVATDERVEQRDLDFALKASKRACEITQWKDPSLVDTYAHVLFARGDLDGAVKYEKKALDLCGPDTDQQLLDSIKDALKEFQGKGKEASIR